MKINQVEELVGITKKNIRFYEDQGLIAPVRNPENGYRDYTLKDVEQLHKIKLLRQLDISIEQIRKVQEGRLALKACLSSQIIHLSHKQHELELMKEICVQMEEKETDISQLQPYEYFETIHKMEEGGVRFMNIEQTDIKKRRIMPIVIAVIMIAFFVAMGILVVWLSIADPATPIAVPVIGIAMSLVFILGILYVLRQRLHEIKGGELDEASKY